MLIIEYHDTLFIVILGRFQWLILSLYSTSGPIVPNA